MSHPDDNPFADPSVTGAAPSTDTPSWLAPPPPEPSRGPGETEMQPSWLGEPSAQSTQPQGEGLPPTYGGPAYGAEPEPSSEQPPMDIACAKLPNEIALMRIANVIASFLLACLAALKLEKNTGDISAGVISLYLFAFGVLLFTFETHLSCSAKIIASNLGFMYRAVGRFCFMLLLGMLCFSDEPLPGFGIFVGVFVIVTAIFNAVIAVKYPLYEKSCRLVDLGGN